MMYFGKNIVEISDLTEILSNLNNAIKTIYRNCITYELQPLSEDYPTRGQLLYQTK